MTDIEGIGGKLSLDASQWKAGADQARESYQQAVSEISKSSEQMTQGVSRDWAALAEAQKKYQAESDASLRATIASMSEGKKASTDWAEGLRATGTPIAELKNELRELQTQLVAIKTAQAEAGAGGSKAFAAQLKSTQLEIAQVSTQLRNAKAAQDEFGQGFQGNQQALTLFSAQISRMAGGIPGLSQGLTGASGAAMGLGTGAASATMGVAGLTVAGVAATGAAVMLGAEWRRTADDIATAADISVAKANEIMQSFRSLAPVAAQDAIALGTAYAEVAGRLGTYQGQALSAAQATDFMRVATEGSLASGEKLDAVVRALAEGLTSSHGSLEDTERVMNALYITSRNTGLGLDQTANLAGRLQERMGAAAPDIVGVGEALTLAAQAGAQGQRGMMPVITLMEHLSELTPKARTNLEGLGIQVQKNANGQLEFARTFESLKAGYDKLTTSEERHALLVSLVGEQTGVLEAMLKSTPEQLQAITSAYDDNNRVAQDAQKRGEELGVMFGKLASQVKNAAGSLAQDMAGALVEDGKLLDNLGTHLQDNVRWWQEWARQVQASGHVGRSFVPPTIPAEDADWEASHRMIPPGGTTSQNEPGGEGRQPLDVQSIRARADALSGLAAEGQRVAKILDTYWKSVGLPSDQKKAVEDITEATNQQALAFERAYDPAKPQQAAERTARLRQLTDEYTASIAANDAERTKAAQNALQAFEHQVSTEDADAERQRRVAAGNRAAAAEATRIANEQKRLEKEAREADPLLGISQGMAKDRDDLIGTAGKVMADLNNAVALKGQQGARAAGEAFAGEARNWGQDLQKAGVEGWQDSVDQLMELARQRIASDDPAITAQIHQLLADGEQAIKDATMWKAYTLAAQREQDAVQANFARHVQAVESAQRSAMESFDSAVRTEADRQYDIWAREQVREIELADQRRADDDRKASDRSREDSDRDEQRLRDKTDREDRAARAIDDLKARQQEASSDADRHFREGQTEAETEHQKRLEEIRKKGGSGMQAALDSEGQRFNDDKAKANRENQVAVADRQAKAYRDIADAQKKQKEAADDATKKAKEQDDDLVKRRAREDADLRDRRANEDALSGPTGLRAQHEQAFHIDAQSKALQRFNDEIARIDAKWAHENEKADEAERLADARAAHEERVAQIRADKTSDMDDQLGAEDSRYASEQAGIQSESSQRSNLIDDALRAAITRNGDLFRAPGFSPGLTGPVQLQAPAVYLQGLIAPSMPAAPSSVAMNGAMSGNRTAGTAGGTSDGHGVEINTTVEVGAVWRDLPAFAQEIATVNAQQLLHALGTGV